MPRRHTAVGPTITGMIDLREEQPDRSKALIIEDGAIPGALAAILPAALYAASFGSPGGHGASRARRLREFARIPLGSYHGPVDRTLTYLVMSTDDSGGRLALENDRIQVTWPEVAEQPVFARDNPILTMATKALHGTPVPDPLWAWTNGRSLITVHPLGGCVMADGAAAGVVDHKGRVFTGNGEDVHEGLYVADGSVISVSLDANPLLTIAAIAERTAEIMIRERGWRAEADNARPAPPPASEVVPKGRLTFTERLTGFVSATVSDDFQRGYDDGRADGALVEILVTIDYDDVLALLNDPKQEARISGTVLAPDLSPHRLTVTAGRCVLLARDRSQPETWHMRYDMNLLTEEGQRYALHGHKVIRKQGARRAWHDTTTLYTTLAGPDGAKLGTGILHLQPVDFTRLVRTIDIQGVPQPKRAEYK